MNMQVIFDHYLLAPPLGGPEAAFWRNFSQLVDYHAQHGSFKKLSSKEPLLEARLNYYRGLHNKRELPRAWEQALAAIGLLAANDNATWNLRFESLKSLRQRPPEEWRPHRSDPTMVWARYQRKLLRNGNLGAKRHESLTAIGFNFNDGPLFQP